jgi:DNA-binding response OmpR family regulator
MVWSYNESIDTHTLETHIYSLRKKIEKKLSLSNLVIFEEKKGYFLNIDIL